MIQETDFIIQENCNICKKGFPLYYKNKQKLKRISTKKEAIKIVEQLLDYLEDYDHEDTKWVDCAEQVGCKKCIRYNHCAGVSEALEKFLYVLRYGIINKVCNTCITTIFKE